jgi:DNA-binding transcriptional ArsR family regulator
VPNQEVELDLIFSALGNTTRRRIVARLIRSPTSVGELAEPLAMALPSVMQHLQVLQDCGLVTTRKLGRVRTCSIESAGLRMAEAWLSSQRTAWEIRLDDLGGYLSQPGDEQHSTDDDAAPSTERKQR